MSRSGRRNERMAFLFVAGLLVFNPPLLLMFDTSDSFFGLPILFVYLFLSWAILIVLAALSMVDQTTADGQDGADEGSSVSRLDS